MQQLLRLRTGIKKEKLADIPASFSFFVRKGCAPRPHGDLALRRPASDEGL
jgi:hypothetical protein